MSSTPERLVSVVRDVASTGAELAGAALILWALWIIHPVLALIVAGIALIGIGILLDPPRRPGHDDRSGR